MACCSCLRWPLGVATGVIRIVRYYYATFESVSAKWEIPKHTRMYALCRITGHNQETWFAVESTLAYVPYISCLATRATIWFPDSSQDRYADLRKSTTGPRGCATDSMRLTFDLLGTGSRVCPLHYRDLIVRVVDSVYVWLTA